MAGELFAIIAPLLITVGIGFAWGKTRQPYDSAFVTNLVSVVGVPALIFDSLTRLEVEAAALAHMAGAMAASLLVFAAVGAAVLRAVRLPFHSYLPSLIFPNVGNMGLPLAYFAFGRHGLTLSIACFAVTAVSQFTFGQWLAAGKGGGSQLFKTPMLYAVIAGAACAAIGYRPPRWLANTVAQVGGLTIPIMLLTLGVSLATIRITSLGRSFGLALLRLALGCAGGFAVAWLFGFSGAARGVLILQASMPIAVFNYLFAQRYGRAPDDVASMILLSTVASFATLPLLLWYLLA